MRIFEYAKVADWESRLQTLATMAEPEPWNYRSVPSSSPSPVLDAYIRYTFLRVHDQQRIAEVAKLACFNLNPSATQKWGDIDPRSASMFVTDGQYEFDRSPCGRRPVCR